MDTVNAGVVDFANVCIVVVIANFNIVVVIDKIGVVVVTVNAS